MDQELLDLLNRLRDEEARSTIPDADLATARETIAGVLRDIDLSAPSAEDLETIRESREYLLAIDSETDSRANAAAGRAVDAAALLDGISLGTDDGGDGGETAPEGETATEPAADDAPPAVEGETPAADAPAADAPAATEAEAALPIAAAATPPTPAPTRLPAITHLASRVPERNRPRPQQAQRGAVLTASGDLPGLAPGQEVDPRQWAQGVMRRYEAVRQMQASGHVREPMYFGSIHVEYPEARILDDNELANEDKINAVVGREALVASGGICGPLAVDYSVTTIASAIRPVRDGLAGFAATRGGVRYILPHTLAAVTNDGPAAIWTNATDTTPGNNVKAHATFACQAPQDATVDAVTSIVQFGNFQARYFPEQIEQYLETVDAVHARLAEATLLAQIIAGSTAVNAGNNGTANTGAASEILAELDRAVAAYRYRHRMAPDSPLHVEFPDYLEDMMRADLARELPGNSGSGGERLAVADAELARFFTVRNLNLSRYIDNPTGFTPTQGWGIQNPGDLLPWPTKVGVGLWHEGAWAFLDGGELNLGMVRDSTLNRTNDFQMFSETFEKAVFRGHESLWITMDLCPDGARAATTDTTGLCATGS